MRVAIDSRWIFPKISGVGKYTQNLIDGLSKIDRSNRYIFIKKPLVAYGLFSIMNQFKLPWLLKRLDVNVYHSTNFMIPLYISRKVKVIVTIHDLIPYLFPQYTPRAKKTKFIWFFRTLLKRIVKRADYIISVSNNTANDIHKHLAVPRDKIKVIYNAIGPIPLCKSGDNTYESNGYILFVGRMDAYKNLTGLIKAYAKLLKEYNIPNKLMIVGEKDMRYPEPFHLVEELGIKDKVVFHGYVDEEELTKIYSRASVFVLPSLYEGFGFPPLEAMANGVPVVVSDTPALLEVVGRDKAVVVDPLNVDDIAAGIYKIFSDISLRDRLIKQGREYVKKFSLERMAVETFNVYKEVASRE